MQVSGLDHVNILTDDLETTASFYERVLGFRRGKNPSVAMGIAGYWMHDGADQPIVHLVDRLTGGPRYDAYHPGAPTNALHHVALRCQGFAETRERLEDLGVEHRVNDLQHIGLKQIFLVDPNAVNLELNFNGE